MRLFRVFLCVVLALTLMAPIVGAANKVETPVAAIAVEPLQIGDRGDEVLAIQQKLSQMGFVVGSMDGV